MIRPATPSDLPAIKALLLCALDESAQALPAYDEARVERVLEILMNSGHGYCKVLVADEGAEAGQIVGLLMGVLVELWYSRARQATDLLFYLKPGYRGRGGLRLLRDFLRWARGFCDCEQIFLGVSIGGQAAERTEALYTRLGFQRVGAGFLTQ